MFWVDKVLFKGWSVNTLLQLALSPLLKKQGELPIPYMQLVYEVPYYKCDEDFLLCQSYLLVSKANGSHGFWVKKQEF